MRVVNKKYTHLFMGALEVYKWKNALKLLDYWYIMDINNNG
jgi:hypothetical protein